MADLVPAETMISPLDHDQARILTDEIKTAAKRTWALVIEAYGGRAWIALGYSSWDDYCEAEFATLHLRLPREERSEVVASLRGAGLSVRAISAATGESKSTVSRLVSGVPNGTGETVVIGTDGKQYNLVPRSPLDDEYDWARNLLQRDGTPFADLFAEFADLFAAIDPNLDVDYEVPAGAALGIAARELLRTGAPPKRPSWWRSLSNLTSERDRLAEWENRVQRCAGQFLKECDARRIKMANGAVYFPERVDRADHFADLGFFYSFWMRPDEYAAEVS